MGPGVLTHLVVSSRLTRSLRTFDSKIVAAAVAGTSPLRYDPLVLALGAVCRRKSLEVRVGRMYTLES